MPENIPKLPRQIVLLVNVNALNGFPRFVFGSPRCRVILAFRARKNVALKESEKADAGPQTRAWELCKVAAEEVYWPYLRLNGKRRGDGSYWAPLYVGTKLESARRR
jgi:hypothetical protein